MTTILLLEPDQLLAKTYKAALEAAGHDVRYCASAQSAITSADAARPDAVVVELQLVSHNGLEFLYEFRSYPDWQDVPVLLLTNISPGAFAASWQLLTGQLGVCSYLYKPRTSLKKFVHAVGDVLPASRAR